MDDIENKSAASQRSYPKLVQLMGRHKDLSLFRSFNDLHLTNLLRMQAELQYLEMCLETAREEDSKAGGDIRPVFIKNFALIREKAEIESSQHDLLKEIAVKLKEYDTALINYMTIRKALKPNKREIDVLKCWIDDGLAADVPDGKTFPQDVEMFIWENQKDLLNLCDKGGDRDKFTEWIEHLLNLYHKLTPSKDTITGEYIRYSSDDNIARASRYASVILSSLMPTLAILVLHFVKSEIIRLILIIAFTTGFSIILALFTTAKKMEVFASTAAFAAVEVVFIGTTGG